jgi:hypothetical protein
MEDVVPSLIEFYDPGKDSVESVESESLVGIEESDVFLRHIRFTDRNLKSSLE